MEVIITAISTVGFPIVCCLVLFKTMNDNSKAHKEETAQLSATIDSLKTIINDNTVMLARVLEHLKGVEDDG